MRRTFIYSLIGLIGCTWPAGCQEKAASVQTIIIEFADLVDQLKTVQSENLPENKTEPKTTVGTQTAAFSTDEPSAIMQTTAASTTTAEQTTAALTTTAASPATVHTHTWIPVTQVEHHDATYKQVWVQDTAAYDEQVEVSAAWDETVLVQDAYDEQVVVSEAWDEPIYAWVGICNGCGHRFLDPDEDINEHMAAGCWSSWHDEWMQVGTAHHDAVYRTVHHDTVYQIVHHDAVYQTVHHDAAGHYESVVDQDAWDETVITGYTCSGCGEKSKNT